MRRADGRIDGGGIMGSTRISLLLAGAVAAGLGITTSAMAASIGVNFTGGRATNPVQVTGPAGVIPQNNWNNEDGANSASPQPLVLDNGSATAATVAWTSTNLWDNGGTPTNQNGNLMFGYLDNTLTTNSTTTITGLPASIAGTGTTPYSVVVYMAGDTAGRGGSWIINGVSFGSYVSKGPSNDGVLVQALPGVPTTGVGATPGNFAVFTGIVGTTLSIQADAESIGSNQRLPFDGFQVVSGVVVPEPASAGLLGLAGLGLLARRQRRATAAS